jgi:hypothetical protein
MSKAPNESALAKFLIGGGVTVALEMGGGHFLEFLKIACVAPAAPGYRLHWQHSMR